MEEYIENIPKCELHVHLEGTMEPSTVKKLAANNGLSLPDVFDESGNHYKPFKDLGTFLQVYYGAMSVIRTERDFRDLLVNYLQKARSQKVQYAEIFFDPQAHLDRHIPLGTILKGLHAGLKAMKSFSDIEAKLIMCFVRDRDIDEADDMLTRLLEDPLRNIVVGVGLDSNEKEHPPIHFKKIFDRAKVAGLKTTMHCDIDQDESIDHIRQALHDIGVDRIDHGTNIVQDKSLVKEIIQKGIGLTCCPISNSFVAEDFKQYQIYWLLEQGAKVTINSDDPGLMGGYVMENIQKLVYGAWMNKAHVLKMQQNAIDISWASDEQKVKMTAILNHFEKA